MIERLKAKADLLINQSLRRKLIVPVILTMFMFLFINLVLFSGINSTVENMNQVYTTNLRLGELEELAMAIEGNVYQYLNIQSADAYAELSENKAAFMTIIDQIDDTITDHPTRQMEQNIRQLALSWVELIDEAVTAKQAHNVTVYKENYEEIQLIYGYLLTYMQGLNDLQFTANFESYNVLYQYLRYLELFIIVVLLGVTAYLVAVFYIVIGRFTSPLEKLTQKAEEVEKGNFGISLDEPTSRDEVGTVTRAFNQMIASINDYIRKSRESLELEIRMKQRELAMENLLKDAQLKYYQAQIDPHFLFNTLNAGQQLAMMEDADRTYEFIANMAAFFRYRLKSTGQDSTLLGEIQLIDNYMYIMNIRYSNEIHMEQSVDERLGDILFPGMVLQPIIENALNHGLGGVEWQKWLWFSVKEETGLAVITIRDNGVGMPQDILETLNADNAYTPKQEGSKNGVGLANVRERLRLYFDCHDVMTFESQGQDQGATITIRVPILRPNQQPPSSEGSEPHDGPRTL
ncbi:histidine kinase [Bengtsoniella intestinalis]|uniref:sensor histidine kinase n=1 Tax=Bengtsoniella intestinalis TaxID=3073143 RepID=UPI00391F1FF1